MVALSTSAACGRISEYEKASRSKNFAAPRQKNFSGTARVSCVREHIALRAGEIRLTVKPFYNSRFIGEAVCRNCPKKRQRSHKIPQTRIFREIWIIKKLNIEAWLSLVERCVRDAEAAGSNPVASTIKG